MKILGRLPVLILAWLFSFASSCGLARLQAQDSWSAGMSAQNLPSVNLAHDLWIDDLNGRSTPRLPTELKAEISPVDGAPTTAIKSTAYPTAAASKPLTSQSAQASDYRSLGQDFPVRVGYDGGFVIASQEALNLGAEDAAYRLVINGYGQLRDTVFDAKGSGSDLNQLQLKRARLIFGGHAFNPDFRYLVQLDGRSNSGDALRILDYYLTYDLGHHRWNLERDTFGIKTGLYKMPFSMARQLSGKELQFSDRSMASMYFDVNRSLAAGLYGKTPALAMPIYWETALFNGLVTGGAETGSSGDLDNNNAISFRVHCFPTGEWGQGELSDFSTHETLASRLGAGMAFTTVSRIGQTEFDALRSVDTGATLASLLPASVDAYNVALYSVDSSAKYLGASLTCEYYFRNVNGFQGADLPDLFDHGFWLQSGLFVIPGKLELLSRWSRVQGNSGTLGGPTQSSEEIASGFAWYFKQQHAKWTVDATYLNGAAIDSSTLDISAGDRGWLTRTQFQFSF